jgi:gamma-glutamyltranspeptidase/glutathione hydrolase
MRTFVVSRWVFTLPLLLAAHGIPGDAAAAYPASVQGRRMAVATDHEDATAVAMSILRGGGSAADAAIAAALALGVVNPSASGVGGGGFAMVYDAKTKEVKAIDFRECAPKAFDAGALVALGEKPLRGPAIGVPGEVAGLEWLSRHYGKRPWRALVAPAATLAKQGFVAQRHLARMAREGKALIEASPVLASSFLPQGEPIAYGTRIKRPALGKTLDALARGGARAFYHGAIAEALVATAAKNGSQLSLTDLAGYVVRERVPLSATVDAKTIYTMPAPSAGGLMLLEVLGVFGASAASPMVKQGYGSSAYFHLMAEAMRGAFADRALVAGDPDFEPAVNADYARMLAPSHIDRRKLQIAPFRTTAAKDWVPAEGGTSHVTVVDGAGNVVALTTTVNDLFGSRIVDEKTGIVLNNELDDFSLPNKVGSTDPRFGARNRPRAGARPVSSMTPTIVVEGGRPVLAIGGSGGLRIATGVAQAVAARLWFGCDPLACVSAPRVHVQGLLPGIAVDADVTDDVRGGLILRGETPRVDSVSHTALEMISLDWQGEAVTLRAAADPRKYGVAAAE